MYPLNAGAWPAARSLGIGLGIAGSGTLVPPLLSLGLQQTWFGLGLLALVLTAASWFGWPASTSHETAAPGATGANAGRCVPVVRPVRLHGSGPGAGHGVPGGLRGARAGCRATGGALIWVMYGLGAIVGPVTMGFWPTSSARA
jgi:hypothetical protein